MSKNLGDNNFKHVAVKMQQSISRNGEVHVETT
jgi:hypothetical protein